jgi:hypothetical protein
MNTINYIVNKLPSKPVFESISGSTIFSIEVNTLAEFDNLELGSFYSSEIDATDRCFFSFYFNLTEVPELKDGEVIRKFKNRLLLFFFHIRFKRINRRPVLFFKSDKEEIRLLISELEQFSVQNGFDGLECMFPEDSTIGSDAGNKHCHVFEKKESLEASYYQLLKTEFYTASVYTIKNVPERLLPQTNSIIASCETKLNEELPLQFMFMKNMSTLSRELADLRSELKHSQEELKNHQSYLEILKSQDEALKINDFYHSEYEVLPLWYKRVGHIIKVITGKRSFRSLFDNNVKKYKN